jgi:hypothetical protein
LIRTAEDGSVSSVLLTLLDINDLIEAEREVEVLRGATRELISSVSLLRKPRRRPLATGDWSIRPSLA